jgi:hypothetical protein
MDDRKIRTGEAPSICPSGFSGESALIRGTDRSKGGHAFPRSLAEIVRTTISRMTTAAIPPGTQQPTPARVYIVRGLGFLAAALLSLAVESIASGSMSSHSLPVMQIIYWLLFAAQTFFGGLMTIVIPLWFLSSVVLPWYLERYDPEQWKLTQATIAARGGPPSAWHHFTFACYFIGGLAMLAPLAKALFLNK